MKTYLFCDLSKKAKVFAVKDYIEGWEETHDKGDLTKAEVYDILEDNDELFYNSSGEYVEFQYILGDKYEDE